NGAGCVVATVPRSAPHTPVATTSTRTHPASNDGGETDGTSTRPPGCCTCIARVCTPTASHSISSHATGEPTSPRVLPLGALAESGPTECLCLPTLPIMEANDHTRTRGLHAGRGRFLPWRCTSGAEEFTTYRRRRTMAYLQVTLQVN